MSSFKIFWSWQSDHDGKISRHFIKNIFNEAIKNISDELELETHERPELDHDVKDVEGPEVIIDSITSKIDSSDHFIADITPIARTGAGKAVPNPNVMIELGYALATMEVSEITLIANSHYYKGPDDLPFDLKGRTGTRTYKLNPAASNAEIKSEKKKQVKRLERILKKAVENVLPKPKTVGGEPQKEFSDTATFWFSFQKPIEGTATTGGFKKQINVELESCANIRIKPEIWPSAVKWPQLNPDKAGVSLFTQMGNNADYLRTLDGYITYEPKTKLDDIEGDVLSMTIVMRNTGEIWNVNYSAISTAPKGNKYLDGPRVLKCWNQCLKNAEQLYNKIGAKGAFNITSGVFNGGPIYARLFGDSIIGTIQGNEPRLSTSVRNLLEDSRNKALIEHFNELCDLAECDRKLTDRTLSHFLH